MKDIVVLGSTGSIGESAIRVIEALPGRFRVRGLAVQRNYPRMLEQARRLRVPHVAVADLRAAEECRKAAWPDLTVHAGDAGVCDVAAMDGIGTVLCALVGTAGLAPVLAAIERGSDVALATKEVLVSAGEIVLSAVRRRGVRLLPVDSEHSALFQCLNGGRHSEVRSLWLTASGGPLRSCPEADMDAVTVEQALSHPRWDMGRKVTIDSATLMNKGLEVIEAHWLFSVPLERIDVVIHPESIVHSVVEWVDGGMLAQLSWPDMRFAIQYALTCPDRVDGGLPRLDLAAVGALHFSRPDTDRFPCLALARDAARTGGTMPAVLSAANEVAVERFLAGALRFRGIWRVVEKVMRRHAPVQRPGLAEVLAADAEARRMAREESDRLGATD